MFYIFYHRFDIQLSFQEYKPVIKEFLGSSKELRKLREELPGIIKELLETLKELREIKKENFLPSMYFARGGEAASFASVFGKDTAEHPAGRRAQINKKGLREFHLWDLFAFYFLLSILQKLNRSMEF